MSYLVDSSAWIEYFKGNQKFLLIDDFINTNTICTNEIILSELLPSIIFKNESKLAELLRSLHTYALVIDWQEIRTMQLDNLKHGNNNIGISDLLIAQNCMQNKLKIITQDKHFFAMAKYMPLEVMPLEVAGIEPAS